VACVATASAVADGRRVDRVEAVMFGGNRCWSR
jgi:hypothetical protein